MARHVFFGILLQYILFGGNFMPELERIYSYTLIGGFCLVSKCSIGYRTAVARLVGRTGIGPKTSTVITQQFVFAGIAKKFDRGNFNRLPSALQSASSRADELGHSRFSYFFWVTWRRVSKRKEKDYYIILCIIYYIFRNTRNRRVRFKNPLLFC